MLFFKNSLKLKSNYKKYDSFVSNVSCKRYKKSILSMEDDMELEAVLLAIISSGVYSNIKNKYCIDNEFLNSYIKNYVYYYGDYEVIDLLLVDKKWYSESNYYTATYNIFIKTKELEKILLKDLSNEDNRLSSFSVRGNYYKTYPSKKKKKSNIKNSNDSNVKKLLKNQRTLSDIISSNINLKHYV